jgi:hypothetical protein
VSLLAALIARQLLRRLRLAARRSMILCMSGIPSGLRLLSRSSSISARRSRCMPLESTVWLRVVDPLRSTTLLDPPRLTSSTLSTWVVQPRHGPTNARLQFFDLACIDANVVHSAIFWIYLSICQSIIYPVGKSVAEPDFERIVVWSLDHTTSVLV